MAALGSSTFFSRLRNPQAVRALIFACACLMAFSTGQLPFLSSLDNTLRDWLMRTQATRSQETRIAVVDIDEASIAQLGPWPWPRTRLADLVELLLTRHGVRAVGLDMIFPDAADAQGDARLAVLAEHAPLALAVAFDFSTRHPPLRQGLPGSGQPASGRPAVTATGYLGNHAGFAAARCVGNIGFVPDTDGTLRRLPARVRFAGYEYVSLATALATCAGGLSETSPDLSSPDGDAQGFWQIPFRRHLESFVVVSANDILADRLPDGFLAGRFVLVGSSALGLADRVATPLAPSVSGVMVHAEALSTLLDDAAGTAPTPWSANGIFSIWLILSIALLWRMLPRLAPWSVLGLLAGLSGAWCGIAWLAAPHTGNLPLTAPLTAYLTVLALALPYEWWRVRQESQHLIETFSHYVSPAVLAEILRQPNFQPLTPTLREVTVLVADMQGYTSQTAVLPLDEAARLTTEFLDCLTRPILATGGTLDKYTGDGVVAFWGAPLPINDHADRAVTAALNIRASVAAWSRSRQERGFPAVRVRIGVESGLALVGDLGTTFRSTYTAVGDCINFAAKLEQAARDLAADIVIGPSTHARLSTKHVVYPLGRIELAGVTLDCWTAEA